MTIARNAGPRLSTVVVAWRSDDDAAELARVFPLRDPRFELIVVDNGSRRALALPPEVVLLSPGRNLGFGAASNLGAERARAPWLLLLNPDARIDDAALEALLDAIDRPVPSAGEVSDDRTAGWVPRTVDAEGRSRHGWALRRLPRALDLLRAALWTEPPLGATSEPPHGAPIEQPAAAAWALKRDVFLELGGFDADFFPAWYEDVDLARRLATAGWTSRYAPRAVVRHTVGSSVSELGFADFLWLHDRSAARYVEKHHGRWLGALQRLCLVAGAGLRLAGAVWRRPRRAANRREAARAYVAKALGAASGWRRPRRVAARFRAD
jgi:N-acetylglucosaminyl-diphospho-decaprenol L-rhamnosyltransferase